MRLPEKENGYDDFGFFLENGVEKWPIWLFLSARMAKEEKITEEQRSIFLAKLEWLKDLGIIQLYTIEHGEQNGIILDSDLGEDSNGLPEDVLLKKLLLLFDKNDFINELLQKILPASPNNDH